MDVEQQWNNPGRMFEVRLAIAHWPANMMRAGSRAVFIWEHDLFGAAVICMFGRLATSTIPILMMAQSKFCFVVCEVWADLLNFLDLQGPVRLERLLSVLKQTVISCC